MPQSRRNRLLDLLSDSDFELLHPHFIEVELPLRMPLAEPDKPIENVWFLVEGVASLVNTMVSGDSSEVGTIGNEGVVGIPVLLGDDIAPTNVYIQVPGRGFRIKSSIVTEALAKSPTMRKIMLRYVHAFFNQVAQSAACNHHHTLEQRCCRWLLMTHDRVREEEFTLTQEFLAMMLGARRTGVTEAARGLKESGIIKYSRGHVTILDRAALEKRSCECYRVNKAEFDRLLGSSKGLAAAAQ